MNLTFGVTVLNILYIYIGLDPFSRFCLTMMSVLYTWKIDLLVIWLILTLIDEFIKLQIKKKKHRMIKISKF